MAREGGEWSEGGVGCDSPRDPPPLDLDGMMSAGRPGGGLPDSSGAGALGGEIQTHRRATLRQTQRKIHVLWYFV